MIRNVPVVADDRLLPNSIQRWHLTDSLMSINGEIRQLSRCRFRGKGTWPSHGGGSSTNLRTTGRPVKSATVLTRPSTRTRADSDRATLTASGRVPIPRMTSRGLASTITLLPVPSKNAFRSSCWLNFPTLPSTTSREYHLLRQLAVYDSAG